MKCLCEKNEAKLYLLGNSIGIKNFLISSTNRSNNAAKYNPVIFLNRTFDDTIGDITIKENSVFKSVTAYSTLYDKILCPQENSQELLKTISYPIKNFNFSNQPIIQSHQSSDISNNKIFTLSQ